MRLREQVIDWAKYPKLRAVFEQRPRENVYWAELEAFVEEHSNGLTFAGFSAANRLRCERDYKEPLDGSGTYDAVHWALNVMEEAGEVAAAVLGFSGKKARKAHLTIADVGRELADLVTYCDLLAARIGIDLGAAVAAKFNAVSDRIGSPIKVSP